jgi:2-polyprenyl-3-methyl-5-hydroxy-6-metoxy-1,4-benzoquinol methylase
MDPSVDLHAHRDAKGARCSAGAPRGITFQPDIYPKVLALMPQERDARILDVGAGEGYFCALLNERGYGCVEACDYLEDNFKVSGVPFHRADLNRSIPLPDASVDAIVSIEVLEHLENHFSFVREILRVLRPGGRAILTTPNILSIPSRWHFFLYGYTDCAPRPLDPDREEYYMQHINPISVAHLLFLTERFGGELIDLTTNRTRRSARASAWLLAPLLQLALRGKLLRAKYAEFHDLYRRHMSWVLHPANLTGRITIAVIRRKTTRAPSAR